MPMTKFCSLALILLAVLISNCSTGSWYGNGTFPTKCKCLKAETKGYYCEEWYCDPQTPGCFSDNSKVTMSNFSEKYIKDLIDGDKLLTIDPKNNSLIETEFIGYLHNNLNQEAIFK